MPGKSPQLTALAIRKQMLVAESEIQRAGLAKEWQALAQDAAHLTADVRAFASVAAGGARLLASGIALKELFSGRARPRHSWATMLLKGAGAGLSVWKALRSGGR